MKETNELSNPLTTTEIDFLIAGGALGVKAQDIHRAGRQAFLGISKDWGLNIDEQRTLLGCMPHSTFMEMERNPEYKFDNDQLDRISYIMGIHKTLWILPIGHSKENIRRWLREPQLPQYAPLFGGKSALDKMLNGGLLDLAEIRRYLEAIRLDLKPT